MYLFVIIVHVIVCIMLVTIILMQSGRGGGLTESFSSAESLFGAKTNVMLVKATTVLASIFLVTCLSLAILSAKRGKSLMTQDAAVSAQQQQTEAESVTEPSKMVDDAEQSSSQVDVPVAPKEPATTE